MREVVLSNKSVTEVQFEITAAVLDVLLAQDDVGPMTIKAVISRQKNLGGRKGKDAKDALIAFAKR